VETSGFGPPFELPDASATRCGGTPAGRADPDHAREVLRDEVARNDAAMSTLIVATPITRRNRPTPLSDFPRKRAGDGNRTRTTSLEGWSSTIELHPRHPQA
jgi:hypothetical protein